MTTVLIIGFISVILICLWEQRTESGRKFKDEYNEWDNDLHK